MRIYIYEQLDQCSPGSEAWHTQGGVAVVTDREPSQVVPEGTGNEADGKYALPEPTAVYELPGDHEERVFIFPDAGCC